MTNQKEIELENKKIKYLRWVVDLSLMEVRWGSLSLAEAYALEESVRRFALRLFPGKEEAFRIIYSPRFRRAISERYCLQ